VTRPQLDLSTINREVLDTLPPVRMIPGGHLGSQGMGCYLDPPGFPTYFIRPQYTRNGKSPRQGTDVELLGREIARAEDYRSEGYKELYRRLYLPLPFDHPRVQAWIVAVFTHMRHSYRDVDRPEYNRPGTLIYPIPGWRLTTVKINAAVDDPEDLRFSETYRAKIRELRALAVQEEETRAAKVAIPENHHAVIAVREIYPDQDPAALLARYQDVTDRPGDWWEKLSERPASPEVCTPWEGYVFSAHRDGGWCQFCGYGG
jgi:hypothetical protein